MASEVKNLGKVHCRVRLYDRLVGLNYEQSKLRKPYSFMLGTQPEINFKRDYWGIQFLTVPSEEAQEHQAACTIPEPCYEPVDNFINNPTSASAGNNVYWTKISQTEVDRLFVQLIAQLNSSSNTNTQQPVNNSSLGPDVQDWTSDIRTVQAKVYREYEYISSGINYPNDPPPESEAPSVYGSSGAAPVPISVNYVFQKQGGSGTWWGIKSNDFCMPGGAFWVSIFPSMAYIPNAEEKTKDAYISIRVATYKGSSILFNISSRGRVFVSYALRKPPAAPPSGSPPSNTPSQVEFFDTRQVAVNLPELSENFKNGNEIKVGFLIACGRLFVFYNHDKFDSVPIVPERPDTPPFIEHINLGEWGWNDSGGVHTGGRGRIAIYGYGCTAYINVCEMTFSKRAWFILKSMDGNTSYKGYKSPVQNTNIGGGVVAAGTYAPGWLINWNISASQYADGAGSGTSHNPGVTPAGCPMYAGQFEYYRERDMVVNPNTDMIVVAASAPSNVPYARGACFEYNKVNGARNWWGRIDIVRHGGISGIYSSPSETSDSVNLAPFWFCYMQTFDWIDGNGVRHERVRYPILYNISGLKPMDEIPEYTEVQQNVKDISDKVMSLDVTSALDNHKPTMIQKNATVTVYDDEDFDTYLLRARGIKIWLKWSTSDNPSFSDLDIAFTGVAFGERALLQPGKKAVVFTCKDYWGVIDRTQIKNSPFYDGFEVFSVIQDLAERVGIKAINDVDHSGNQSNVPGSTDMTTGVPFYFLGSGFSFDKPKFRFESTNKISECLAEIIKSFPYYMWFDVDGTLKVSVVPGNFDNSCINPALFHSGWDYSIKNRYYRSIGSVSPNNPERLILNELQMTSNLKEGVFNSFMVKGVERSNNTMIIVTDSNQSSLNNPNSDGYLGFVSDMTVQQPALDSEAAARFFLERYKRMWSKPGFETTITTIGHIPKYTVNEVTKQTRPGHFIKISQNITPDDHRFRLTEIKHNYDAEKNEWITSLGAYQIHAPAWTPNPDPPPPPPPTP